ncbi:MAG: translation initiation factor IF-3 [Fimbriimonadaceae bacterium]|nr:translation initiation factor IF-3 [Fimbriimonadaceae bacterium]
MRLIGEEGNQMGVLRLRDALDAAYDAGLDLIEVAPDADPPVCRIMDWGRFRYEQKQRERDQRRKQKVGEVKGLRLRPSTGVGDFQVIRRKAESFMRDGHKVRIELRFRGREITHRELGQQMLDRLATALENIGEIEQQAVLEGKRMFMTFAPLAEIIGTAMTEADQAALAADEASGALDQDDDDDDDVVDPPPPAESSVAPSAEPDPADSAS